MSQMAQSSGALPSSDPDLTDSSDFGPDSTNRPYKSNSSDIESDSTASAHSSPEEQKSKKRKQQQDQGPLPFKLCKTSSDESRSSSGDSALSSGDFLPGKTSSWDTGVLDRLRIHWKMVGKEHDGNFFGSIITDYLINEDDQKKYEKYKEDIKEGLDQLRDHICLILESIDMSSVPEDNVLKQMYLKKQEAENAIGKALKDIENLTSKVQSRTLKEMKNMTSRVKNTSDLVEKFQVVFCRVLASGMSFLETLEEMAFFQKNYSLPEKMYERLFMEFLNMFRLNASDVGIRAADLTVQISGVEHCVTSKPDLVVGIIRRLEDPSKKVVAICEMKKDYSKSEEMFMRETRSKKDVKEARNKEVHIPQKLLGQHGGELLLHLPNSVFGEKGILGMIVQGTEVSLTAFLPEKDYLKNMREGFVKGSKEANMYISGPYNFLTIEGRADLCKPLFELLCTKMFFEEKYN